MMGLTFYYFVYEVVLGANSFLFIDELPVTGQGAMHRKSRYPKILQNRAWRLSFWGGRNARPKDIRRSPFRQGA